MSQTYKRQIETARRLLDKYGGAVVLTPNVEATPVIAEKPWRKKLNITPTIPPLLEELANNNFVLTEAGEAGSTLHTATEIPLGEVNAAFFPLESVARPGSILLDGAQTGSQAVLISAEALGFEPRAGDTITRTGDANDWRIDAVDVLNVNGEPILYTLRVIL